jgi:hypothetical protein
MTRVSRVASTTSTVGVELVDAHEPGDLAWESFDEVEGCRR